MQLENVKERRHFRVLCKEFFSVVGNAIRQLDVEVGKTMLMLMRMRRSWLFGLAFLLVALALAAKAGSFLLIDAPEPSDVILVLAGETEQRPRRALELLGQGYARRIVLDVPTNADFYGTTLLHLAEKYVQALPESTSVTICPIDGLSTKDESEDADKCLQRQGAKSVLIVTSDFHTRRALSIFRKEVPGHHYSVAASRQEKEFGARWWRHRQWAKTLVDEWLRLLWWKLVDEWE